MNEKGRLKISYVFQTACITIFVFCSDGLFK